MSFPRYGAYKDSGVEWLGEVPGHWEIWKLTHDFRVIGSGTTPKTENSGYYEDGEIPWLNTGDLNDGDLYDCERRITRLAVEENSALKLYDPGAVVIAMYGATIGKLGVLRFTTAVNQACCVFQKSERIFPRFLFYWLLGLRSRIISLAYGGGQPNISQEILRGLRLACPAPSEQTAITAFLDRETAKVDALVEEQQRLIALLKEKRQAVISHAVTKGLDPDAPMKDSGVEWLGEVPAHWEVGPLKRRWSVTDCKHVTAEFVADGIPLASIREAQGRYVDLSDAKLTTEEFYEQMIEGGRKPMAGDLIFTRNATVGEVAQVTDAHPRFAMGQDVCLLRKLGDDTSSDFMWHLLRSHLTEVQIANLTIGSTFKRINVEEIRNLSFPIPPYQEQHDIASALDSVTSTFEALTAEANAAIALLRERRSALISAAVTGKIDVRGLVADPAEVANPAEAA